MKALTAYLDKENQLNALFKQNLYEIHTASGRKRVAESIDCKLSPENLTCDGELSRSEVQARYRALTSAAQDLIRLDPSVAQYMYEFN